jgi:hypothetical protein
MSLELVNTLGTLITVAIIAATAIAAMGQLRHLRAGNQISAMLSISNQFDEKEFRDALVLIQHKLDATMDDPRLREFDVAIQRGLPVQSEFEESRRIYDAARLVANTYEELGILVKNEIVDRDLFLDRYCWVILSTWKRMRRRVAWLRELTGQPAIWENFEYLTVLSEDWMREHESTYPKGLRRLELHNPWPVPPAPASA